MARSPLFTGPSPANIGGATCFTCPLKIWAGKEIECRNGPPHASAIVGQGAMGQATIATVTAFPRPQPDYWCWDHPNLVRPVAQPAIVDT